MQPADHSDPQLDSERHIRKYVEELAKFCDDRRVAEQLAKAQRSMAFRARMLSPAEFADLLDRARKLAEQHPDDAEVQEPASEAVLIALAAIARDRPGEILDQYSVLSGVLRGEHVEDGVHNTLCGALRSLLDEIASTYPALAFTIWSDVGAIAASASPQVRWDRWIPLACTLAIHLARKDSLAAFAVWSQGLQWSRDEGFDQTAATDLVASASSLLRSGPAGSGPFDQTLWSFITVADSARGDGDDGRRGRLSSITAAVQMACNAIAATVPRDRPPERALAIDSERTQSVARAALDPLLEHLFACALGWMTEDVLLSPDWAKVMDNLLKALRPLRDAIPRVAGFVGAIGAQTTRVRQHHLAQIKPQLRLSTAPSAWIDPPPAALGWQELTDAAAIRHAASHLFAPGSSLDIATLQFERVRAAQPAFYPAATLFDAQVKTDRDETFLVYFIVLPDERHATFDGGSRWIHDINSVGGIAGLDNPETVMDYLRFFCSAVTGEEGPFWIVTAFDDAPFTTTPSPEVEAKIRAALNPDPKPYEDVDCIGST